MIHHLFLHNILSYYITYFSSTRIFKYSSHKYSTISNDNNTTQPEVPTVAHTPAQTTQTQNIQPALTINSLQSNPLPNYTITRHLSTPPLQILQTNPLSYSLTSTNPNNTQTTIANNNQLNTLNPSTTSQQPNISSIILHNFHFQLPNPPSTIIRTNPYMNATYSQPATNPPNIPSNVSNIPLILQILHLQFLNLHFHNQHISILHHQSLNL